MPNGHAEKQRLKKIEDRLKQAKHVLEGILPIHAQVDRRVKGLESEIANLEEERLKLLHGQITMNFSELDF